MRLFEVDQGSARSVLAVLQGLANRMEQSAELPFATVMNILRPFNLGIGSAEGLIALKNDIDPAGDVIEQVLDNGTIILKTRNPSELKGPETGTAPNIDSMASQGAKKLQPDI